MNKLLIATLALAITGCSSTSETKHAKKMDNVVNNVELAKFNSVGFCEGSKMNSYLETKYYYSLTCMDGRSFILPKGEK